MNQQEFKGQPVLKNIFLKQAVIGISDGLIICFAATTALSVIYTDTTIIVKFAGILSIICGIILGIGGYLAAKFRMESLATKTVAEEERLKKEETDKTIALFQKLGIGEDMQEQAVTEIEKDSLEWKSFLEKNQQPFEIPDKKELSSTGIIIGITFIIGAALALLPYLLVSNNRSALQYTIISSLALLLIIGFIKSKINGEPVLGGGIRLMLLGAAAAALAWLVAGIFVN
jgi:vacuolar iron transporter family protein